MKLKIYFLVSFLLLCFLVTKAQNEEIYPKKSYFGVKAGSNFSQINLDVIQTNPIINSKQFYNGISGGFVYKNMTEKYFALQIELLYSQKSGQNYFEKAVLPDTTNMPNYIPYKLTLNQIELPFLTNFNFGRGKNKLNFLLGPYVAYSVINKTVFTDSVKLADGKFPPIKRNFELGIAGGLGYGRVVGTSMIELELRFSQAFTNIYNTKSVNKSLIYQTQALTVSVSYLYSFTK